MSDAGAPLGPVLVHIQSNLDGDLSLAALSRQVGLSPAHFHRRFQAAVGETPRAYVARVRVERAAFRLVMHDASVLAIALECGFRNHETFIRTFRRQFGRAPGDYRTWQRNRGVAARGTRVAPNRPPSRTAGPAAPLALSATRVVHLRACQLASIRHVGPYEAVPQSLFDRLADWAHAARLRAPYVWMGIGHDAPLTTAAAQRRFDAAIVVPAPFRARDGVACQRFPGGEFAVTTHVGSAESIPDAYRAILPRVLALHGYRFVGLPAVELYRTVSSSSGIRITETDICLPVTRIVVG